MNSPDIFKRLKIVYKELRENGDGLKLMSEACKVAPSTIYRMMKGEMKITDRVIKGCVKLGYTPNWLITGEGQKKIKGDDKKKVITDLNELRVELDMLNIRVNLMSTRLEYALTELEKRQ